MFFNDKPTIEQARKEIARLYRVRHAIGGYVIEARYGLFEWLPLDAYGNDERFLTKPHFYDNEAEAKDRLEKFIESEASLLYKAKLGKYNLKDRR